MLITWKRILGLVAAGAVAALLITWSGVIGISASTGHWKVTDWFLHWAMRSSVRTAALGTEVPPFTDGMLPMAAGHFEAGCAICHGSPALPRPKSVNGMLPVPPELGEVVSTWSDAELFQIVQHGVRFTGMPAWPVAGREDEAWAMVAFLRRYRELDATRYRELAGFAATTSSAMERVLETCNGCHAEERLNDGSLIPRLSGQSPAYLEQSLQAYFEGTRPSGVMAVATQGLTDRDRLALARHFAGEPAQPPSGETALAGSSGLSKRGEELARQGDPARRLPACLSCHEKADGNPAYPRISGQPVAYIKRQLELFSQKKRGGGPYRAIMERVAENLAADDIEALAAYFAARPSSAR
jgi:cytochrome c553